MATRSNIIAKIGDKWARIYCHWDGYPEGVGAMLKTHYTDPDKIARLMALGDLSALYEECDGAPGHTFDKPVTGQTIAYGRDRGEKDLDTFWAATLRKAWPQPNSWVEYVYVNDGSGWQAFRLDGTALQSVS